MYIEKVTALKILYFLAAADGQVDPQEEEQFTYAMESFGVKDPNFFKDLNGQIAKARGWDYLENLTDLVTDLLKETSEEPGETKIYSKMMLWNVLTICYANGAFGPEERRMVRAILRSLNLPPETVPEMEHLVVAGIALQKEMDHVSNLDRYYREIRPVMAALEKRQQDLLEQVQFLLVDDSHLLPDLPEAKNYTLGDSVKNVVDGTADGIAKGVQNLIDMGSSPTLLDDLGKGLMQGVNDAGKAMSDTFNKGFSMFNEWTSSAGNPPAKPPQASTPKPSSPPTPPVPPVPDKKEDHKKTQKKNNGFFGWGKL